MPITSDNQPGMFNPYGRGGRAPESPGIGETLGAAFRQENPVVSTWDYLDQPLFETDDDFDVTKAGENDEVYYNHGELLARARSQDEYNHIRGNILKEQKDRDTLAAAGLGGLGAAILAGTLSPTMFLPAFGPARGARGIAQAFALAGTAATLDEIVLYNTQDTRTAGETAFAISAGTVMGGLLGSAFRHMTPTERVRVEVGMGRSPDEQAILPLAGNGSRTEIRVMDADNLDVPPVRYAEADGTIGAKRTRPDATGLKKSNFVARGLVDTLARLNPATRTANQEFSPAVRSASLSMQDAGLLTEGNVNFIPHAPEGHIEARTQEYEAFTADLLLAYDDAYARHISGDKLPEGKLQKAGIARIKAAVTKLPKGKLSNEDFSREVFRVANTGEQHPDPHVMKAAKAWETYADKIRAYADEAYEHLLQTNPDARRLFDPEGDLGPDAHKWISHVFDPEKIQGNSDEFIKDLSENAQKLMQSSFNKAWERFNKTQNNLKTQRALMGTSAPEARRLYKANEDRLREIRETPIYDDWYERGLELQRAQRAAKKIDDEEVLEQIKLEQKEHKENVSDELADLISETKILKSYNKILNQSVGKRADQIEELEAKIEELDIQDQNALARVTEAGLKLGDKLNRMDDKTDAEFKKLWKQLGAAMKSVSTQERLMQSVYKKGPLEGQAAFDAYERFSLLSRKRDEADAKAEGLIRQIEDLENFDLEHAKSIVKAVQDLNNIRVRDLNAKRAIRAEKLKDKIEDLDPEKVQADLKELDMEINMREEDFDTRWRRKGAVGTPSRNNVDFAEYGQEQAQELQEKILGMSNPISGMEILGGKRGPELARVLNLPLAIKTKYLETDIERLGRIYTRKIAPDIEMYRRFGSVNASKVFDQLELDFRNFRERLGAAETRPKSKKNYNRFIRNQPLVDADKEEFIPWPAEEKKQALADTYDYQKEMDTDLRVMVTRIRHQRGLPDDPNGLAYRFGRAAKDVNVFRFMGSVLPSSLADVSRPVMRFGASKTLRHGYLPFITNMRRVKMTRDVAKRIGIGLDPIMHNRTQAVLDLADDYASRKSTLERGIGFLANKTGLVAMFDRWTAEMKHIASGIMMAEMSHVLRALGAGKIKPEEIEFLSEVGLDEPMARRILAQLTSEKGGSEIDGVILPNLEDWTDVAAKRAYAASLNKIVNDLIVTPGIDKPNWVDANMAGQVVSQFRSFTFASNNRTLLRGAQQPDMALAQGMMLSLAMGMLSYYTWAVSRGGESLNEAHDADFGKWVDEAISRSGILGVLQMPWETAQKIPGLGDAVTFSGESTTNRRPVSLMGSVFGPTVDLAEKTAKIAQGIGEPTQSTVHDIRLISAYQNVFYLRQLFDMLEDTVSSTFNIPERRGQ